jgi:hypothetical protein
VSASAFVRKGREPFHSGCASALKIVKFVMVGAVVALALTVVILFQLPDFGLSSTLIKKSQSSILDQSGSVGAGGISASPPLAKLLGVNVTVIGTIGTYTVSPACSLATPPCAITESVVYYVTVNGRNYRLLFQNRTSVPDPLLGSLAVVTGLYVTPSTFKANDWTPVLSFYGDIYVQVITYFHTLPR